MSIETEIGANLTKIYKKLRLKEYNWNNNTDDTVISFSEYTPDRKNNSLIIEYEDGTYYLYDSSTKKDVIITQDKTKFWTTVELYIKENRTKEALDKKKLGSFRKFLDL